MQNYLCHCSRAALAERVRQDIAIPTPYDEPQLSRTFGERAHASFHYLPPGDAAKTVPLAMTNTQLILPKYL